MQSSPIRVGFIGGGLNSAVGYAHHAAIHLDKKFLLTTGSFSLESDVNLQTAEAYGVTDRNLFSDWRQMITDARSLFDAVIVLTPTPSHTEIVLECLNQGIPVVCEKALCLSSLEAVAINDRLRSTNGFLAVTYNYSGYPLLRELKHRIDAGQFGEIRQIQIEMPQEGFIRRNPATNATNIPQSWRQLDHGVTTLALDLGVHLHHIVSFLTNCKPLELVAKEDHLGNVTNVVDNVNCIVKYSNGMICSMWFGKSALGYRNGLRVRLFGTEGAAEWTQTDPENLYLCDKYGSKRTIDRSDPENLVANLPRYCRFKPGHPAGFIEAFANYYADIAEAIAGQNVSHRYVAGIDTALESMHFLEAISISSRSNRWEPIPHRT